MAEGEVIEIGECSDQEDSDCEIQEESVPVIDVVSEDEVCQNCEAPGPEQNEPSKKLPSTSPLPTEEGLLTISFTSKKEFLNLKECITSAIGRCLKEKGICTTSSEDEHLRIFFIKSDNIAKEERSHSQDDEIEAEEDDSGSMFLIDTNPAEKIEIGSIPSYKRAIKDVMDSEIKKSKLGDNHCERPKTIQSCFNCFGSHSLRDCPEPRNHSRINKARKQFMESKSERYHIDIEQRFAHFRPGQLSDGLRKALGLGRRELPSFFYRMRVMGYPPGWLEEAKVAHSGIALFDSEGREVLISDEEDGEVDIERHKYDPTKIITFPGFNADPGPEFFDDHNHYGVPPMQKRDLKEEFIRSLGEENIVKGYKRKKLKNLSAPTEHVEESVPIIADMEIEDVVDEHLECLPPLPPPLPDELSVPPPPPPMKTPERNSTPTQEIPERGSPSLEDLVAKQRALLEALENSSLTPDVTMQDDSLIDEVLELERETEAAEAAEAAAGAEAIDNAETENSQEPAENAIATDSKSLENCPSPQTPNLTNRKASIPGTPILKFSPYDKLPEGEQFKKGVSDVLFFENLPDATGKFEKMKDVIKKVRTVVTKLNSEN